MWCNNLLLLYLDHNNDEVRENFLHNFSCYYALMHNSENTWLCWTCMWLHCHYFHSNGYLPKALHLVKVFSNLLDLNYKGLHQYIILFDLKHILCIGIIMCYSKWSSNKLVQSVHYYSIKKSDQTHQSPIWHQAN